MTDSDVFNIYGDDYNDDYDDDDDDDLLNDDDDDDHFVELEEQRFSQFITITMWFYKEAALVKLFTCHSSKGRRRTLVSTIQSTD